MDSALLQYMLAIEKHGSISAAARALYMTPSALNQQLTKLEKELNVHLFSRHSRHVVPTDSGKLYLDMARHVLEIENDTYRRIQEMSENPTGTYRIGLTYDHGTLIFSNVYPAFHEAFPNIRMMAYQYLVPDMIDMLKNHELDLVITLGKDIHVDNDYNYIPLSAENILVGINAKHPLVRGMDPAASPTEAIDLNLIRNDYLAVALAATTMRQQVIDPVFKKNECPMNIMIESSINGFLQNIAAKNICHCIIPQSTATNHRDIVWFYLDHGARFELGILYSKTIHLGKALRYFVVLAQEYAQKHLDYPLY